MEPDARADGPAPQDEETTSPDPLDVVGVVLLALFILGATAGGFLIRASVGCFTFAGGCLVAAVFLSLGSDTEVPEPTSPKRPPRDTRAT